LGFVFTECTVQCGKFTQLVSFELVLAFRDRCSRLDNLINHFDTGTEVKLAFGHYQTMQIFVFAWSVGAIGTGFAWVRFVSVYLCGYYKIK
jgi:hypothetical protein